MCSVEVLGQSADVLQCSSATPGHEISNNHNRGDMEKKGANKDLGIT